MLCQSVVGGEALPNDLLQQFADVGKNFADTQRNLPLPSYPFSRQLP
jgi:hypothetical protein